MLNDVYTEDDLIMKRLKLICEKENVAIENDGVLDKLIDNTEGDLRRAITSLQSCYRLKGGDHVLSETDVEEICGVLIQLFYFVYIF